MRGGRAAGSLAVGDRGLPRGSRLKRVRTLESPYPAYRPNEQDLSGSFAGPEAAALHRHRTSKLPLNLICSEEPPIMTWNVPGSTRRTMFWS